MTKEQFEKFDGDYEVCECIGVTLEEIQTAIGRGCDNIEAIMEETDAGSACGLCISVAEDEGQDRDIHLDEVLEHTK